MPDRPEPPPRRDRVALGVTVVGLVLLLTGGGGWLLWAMRNGDGGPADKRAHAREVIAGVRMLIDEFERQFGDWPRTKRDRMRGLKSADGSTPFASVPAAPNGTHEGIESLLYQVRHVVHAAERVDGPDGTPPWPWTARDTGDRDGDMQRELIDPWGRPLVYLHHQAYAASAEAVRGAGGRFLEPKRFQLYSVGPDGTPGTDDDLGLWESDD